MAEIVEYRVEKTLEELSILVDLGLFNTKISKEILSKRQNFEYALRRKTRTKLDYLRYIKYEMNLLDAIEKYRNTVVGDYFKSKTKRENPDEELEKRILMLKGKKLNQVINSRAAHISRLFMKMTISFQFDKELWLAYIEFAKSRKWNTRVTSLYWRVLRVRNDDENIWVEATKHEVKTNRAYDVGRGLYLRAIRHFPKSVDLWSGYFNMEVDFMTLIHRRALVLQNGDKGTGNEESTLEISIDEREEGEDGEEQEGKAYQESLEQDHDGEKLPNIKAILEDNSILSGELPKAVFNNACKSLSPDSHLRLFVVKILRHLIGHKVQTKHVENLRNFICESVVRMHKEENDQRFGECLVKACEEPEKFADVLEKLKTDLANELDVSSSRIKRMKTSELANSLDDCYGAKGIEETRKLFKNLDKSVKNQTMAFHSSMIEIEHMEMMKLKTDMSGKGKKNNTLNKELVLQLDRLRNLFEVALSKFGSESAQLWIEFIKLESCNAKNLEDVKRLSELYQRAQLCLKGSELDKVVEGYALIQAKQFDTNELIKFA